MAGNLFLVQELSHDNSTVKIKIKHCKCCFKCKILSNHKLFDENTLDYSTLMKSYTTTTGVSLQVCCT